MNNMRYQLINMTFINNVSHENGNKTTASIHFVNSILHKNQNKHFTQGWH